MACRKVISLRVRAEFIDWEAGAAPVRVTSDK
jgi:hypothetical protein